MKNNEEIIIELLTEILESKKADNAAAEKSRQEQRLWTYISGGCAYGSFCILILTTFIKIFPIACIVILAAPVFLVLADIFRVRLL